jgi:hypothetical protein
MMLNFVSAAVYTTYILFQLLIIVTTVIEMMNDRYDLDSFDVFEMKLFAA